MFFWLGIATFGGAAVVAIRWYFTRVDALGRVAPFPWLGVSLLIVLAGGLLAPSYLRARLEARLADAAGQLIGTEVEVECQSFGQAFVDTGAEFGFVPFGPDGVPERRALIKRNQCADLADYLGSNKVQPSFDHVVAVHTLTHEAIHMSGVTSEAETECMALQRDAEMARLLGAPSGGARALSVHYWQGVYPRMPEPYRSDACRPGGALDIRAPEAPWNAGRRV
ncbi:MAG: hypothetical protein ACRDKT_17075 [Actinomycetota bacterium]